MQISALVSQHYEPVFRFAFRLCGGSHEAEDLTQQAFLDAQRKLDSLREPEKARAWLYVIVRNLFRRGLRDVRERTHLSLDEISKMPGTAMAAPETLDRDTLRDSLSALPPEFREVLVLFYFQELSYREIAEALSVPIGTVMSRLSRGKALLRQRLNPDDY